MFVIIIGKMKDCTLYRVGVRDYPVSYRTDMTSFAELHNCNEYWRHCAKYPHCVPLNDDLFDELSGILTYLIVGTSFIPS